MNPWFNIVNFTALPADTPMKKGAEAPCHDPKRLRYQAEMPLSVSICCNSPDWNISRVMSQPPMNSPLI